MSDYLKDLTDEQLRSVASAVDARIKDARKKATQSLSKKPDLLGSWIATLSKTSGEEDLADRVRDERKRRFEKALAENPEAFVLYHMSNYLRGLSEAIRVERLARANRPAGGP